MGENTFFALRIARASLAVLSFSVVARGDVLITYESAVDADPGTTQIEIVVDQLGVPFSVDVAATTVTGGTVELSGASFGFGADNGAFWEVSGFAWDWGFDLDDWFPDSTLPYPILISFGPVAQIPPTPDALALARIDVIVAPDAPLDVALILDTHPGLGGGSPGDPIDLEPGSEFVAFVVIPEPGAVVLLALGMWCARRRVPVQGRTVPREG